MRIAGRRRRILLSLLFAAKGATIHSKTNKPLDEDQNNEPYQDNDKQQKQRSGGDLVIQLRPTLTQFHQHRIWWQELVHKFLFLTPTKLLHRSARKNQHAATNSLYDAPSRRMAHSTAAVAIVDPLDKSLVFLDALDDTCDSEEGKDDDEIQMQEAPHAGMRLTVTSPPNSEYELLEAVDYKLGDEKNQQYSVDYAYRPVQVVAVYDDYEDDHHDHGYILQKEDKRQLVSISAADSSVPSRFLPHARQWWQWWRPLENDEPDRLYEDPLLNDYKMNARAFAGGSHGEVWRGRKRRTNKDHAVGGETDENLIFKRLRIEHGYRILEAGLREVHFGRWLAQQAPEIAGMYTHYVDHFFRTRSDGELELWMVFRDAGPSLRSYLYTAVSMGDFVFYKPSDLWTRLRMSVSDPIKGKEASLERSGAPDVSLVGRKLMRTVLRQVLEAAAHLHENRAVHRDIKPSNVMCTTNLDTEDADIDLDSLQIKCVLGDLSSAWDEYSRVNFYTRGPSRLEQTDEYAPPEAIFGYVYRHPEPWIDSSFDSWSIGVLALEMLLGTPNVFSVDQRTTAILSHKLKKEGASDKDIQRALYLAALSQFCIFNPSQDQQPEWPLRRGDPLHQYSMVKSKCTLHDFHRGLLARDPLGIGFDSSVDSLLHLIWQLLSWDPKLRITAAEALQHPYFSRVEVMLSSHLMNDQRALESQMLDPRMDFNLSDSVAEFRCPKCGRVFDEWNSCLQHSRSRGHSKFCTYDRQSLPSCLHAHSMLPVHNMSGYCDIQGRRKTIEDFHSIHLTNNTFYYGIFDGHSGNFAAKYVASSLYDKLEAILRPILQQSILPIDWKEGIERSVSSVFAEIHHQFLEASWTAPRKMDQSGTTATAVYVAPHALVVASIGDSRAVLGSVQRTSGAGISVTSALQLTKDHVASDPDEQRMVMARGGKITFHNGVYRVGGTLAITRSIGDNFLSPYLSREPDIVSLSTAEVKSLCVSPFNLSPESDNSLTDGATNENSTSCFLILASDGLWDTMSNEDAVDMVAQVLMSSSSSSRAESSNHTKLQEAAEALTLEAYVRGSRDNIGVAVIAL